MNNLDRRALAFAQSIDRRVFLRRTAQGVFAAATGWAFAATNRVYGAVASNPSGSTCPVYTTIDHCTYPAGDACRGRSSSFCNGSNCSGGCSSWTKTQGGMYATGCWCTKTFCTNGGRRGYWRCCDCYNCPNGSGPCGCRLFHQIGTCSAQERALLTSTFGELPGDPPPGEIVQGVLE